jgi:uncharacterized protein (DUF1778 family)
MHASPEQHELINGAVALLGKRPSDFMLDVACEHAQVILCGQTFFGFDSDQFRAFTVLLHTPVHTNTGLEQLMKLKASWET